MATQVRAERPPRRAESAVEEQAPERRAHEYTPDVLADIDAILSEAEQFEELTNYQQKGGE